MSDSLASNLLDPPGCVTPFAAFLDLIGQIQDPRRTEGKLYRPAHVVLFAILASLAGANSYRTVETFIDVHLK